MGQTFPKRAAKYVSFYFILSFFFFGMSFSEVTLLQYQMAPAPKCEHCALLYFSGQQGILGEQLNCAGSLNLRKMNILSQVILYKRMKGGALCITGHLTLSSACVHEVPIAPTFLSGKNSNV